MCTVLYRGRILASAKYHHVDDVASTPVRGKIYTIYPKAKVSHHLTYPLTTRVVGAPHIISQPVSSILTCSSRPSETWRTLFLSISWCCLFTSSSDSRPVHSLMLASHLFLSALSSSPFHCALQDGFGQTWLTRDMTIQLQFASLYGGQAVFMWSDYLLALGAHFFVGNMVLHEMRCILR